MNRKKDYFCTTIKFIENPTQTHWMKHYRKFRIVIAVCHHIMFWGKLVKKPVMGWDEASALLLLPMIIELNCYSKTRNH